MFAFDALFGQVEVVDGAGRFGIVQQHRLTVTCCFAQFDVALNDAVENQVVEVAFYFETT